MNVDNAAQFLGNLLNKPVEAGTALRLSSAQRARFLAWLHAQGQTLPDTAIKGEFSLVDLTGQPNLTAAKPIAPASSEDAEYKEIGDPTSIGIDIQSVAELTACVNILDLKADPSLTALFTTRELSYAQARQQPLETLAGLWAAKEAMRKCMGGPELPLHQMKAIEVLPDEHGRPINEKFALSISHSAGLAVAVAVRREMITEAFSLEHKLPGPIFATTQLADPKEGGSSRLWKSTVLLALIMVILLNFIQIVNLSH